MPILYLFFLLIAAPVASLELNKLLRTGSTEGSSLKNVNRLSNALIGDDGRFYACSGNNLFAFERNGTIAWIIPINYSCNTDITPVTDERGKIYLVAEDRILKITPTNVGTSKPTVENFFGPNSTIGGSGEIIGLSVSSLYASLFVSVKGRGLFALLSRGRLLWTAGPILYRFGYRQGCKTNITDCYFSSAPVVDQCEGTLYIVNTEGQLYSLYIRIPNFRWIQDFSSFDKLLTVTPGNNGRLYVTFPRKALLLALDDSSGNVIWQMNIGPLSTEKISVVVDSNGWVSVGSLDGFLYTISPSGDLKKFLQKTSTDSVIQISPVLDCSGFALYISQTVMEEKSSRIIGNYTYISAMKPVKMIFSLLAPATGTVYWTGMYPGELSSLVSRSDLHYFVSDERILLSFLASAGVGNTLPCYSKRQKIAWTCSQAESKFVSIYTENEEDILLFLLFQLVILVLLGGCVRFCCIFWRKKKLQVHGLSGFLEKRRSLHSKRKALTRMISELEQKATEDASTNETLDHLGEIVRAKEGVERKLSTSYSLGRDRGGSQGGSILPLYDGKTKSHSFCGARKESVTIFNTLSETSTSGERISSSDVSENSSSSTGEEWHSFGEVELTVMQKGEAEAGPSNRGTMSDGNYGEGISEWLPDSRIFTNAMLSKNQIDESSSLHSGEEEHMVPPVNEGIERRRMWLKRRRTLSSTN